MRPNIWVENYGITCGKVDLAGINGGRDRAGRNAENKGRRALHLQVDSVTTVLSGVKFCSRETRRVRPNALIKRSNRSIPLAGILRELAQRVGEREAVIEDFLKPDATYGPIQ